MKTRLFRVVPGCLAALALVAIAVPFAVSAATSAVVVDLKDTTADSTLTGMAIAPSRTTLKAGDVSFSAVNRSKALVHEMILVKLDTPDQAMPYDTKEDKIDEERIKHLGEVSELEPGKSGTLRVKLAPGVYALLCNQPGHYNAGMISVVTVTK